MGGAPLGHSMNLISVFVSSLFRLHVRGGAPLGHPMNLISVFAKRLAVLCSIPASTSEIKVTHSRYFLFV